MDYNTDEDLQLIRAWAYGLRKEMAKLNEWGNFCMSVKKDILKQKLVGYSFTNSKFENMLTYFLKGGVIYLRYYDGEIWVSEAHTFQEMKKGERQGRLRTLTQ